MKELRGIKFTFGRQYFIEIKNFNCEITRIKLNSFYGIKSKEYYKIWAGLLQELWDFYLITSLIIIQNYTISSRYLTLLV